MAVNQIYIFIVFILVGVVIGVLFDFFRILRKAFKTKDFVTNIEDITFWIITGIIVLYSMYVFCNGQLRLFMILGIIFGIIFYMITISKYIIKISVFIINFIKNVMKRIIRFSKTMIYNPIVIICINLKKYLKFCQKNEKK